MEIWKDWWVQAGSAGVLVGLLIFACWTLWKRNVRLTDKMLEMAADSAARSEAFRASAEASTKASDGTAAALRDLSLRIASWGGRGAA